MRAPHPARRHASLRRLCQLLALALFVIAPLSAKAGRRAEPLVKAFKRHSQALERGLGAPRSLVDGLALSAWRDWVPHRVYRQTVDRLASRAKSSPAGVILRLESARLQAESRQGVEAHAKARADGWLAEGILDCSEPGWVEAGASRSLSEGGMARVSLPAWAQPIPFDRIVPIAPGAGCRFLSPFTLARGQRVELAFDASQGAVLKVDGEWVATRSQAGALVPDGLRLSLELDAGDHVIEVHLPASAEVGLGQLYLRLKPATEALSSEWPKVPWLRPVHDPRVVRMGLGGGRVPHRVRDRGGALASLERLLAAADEGSCDAALLLGRPLDDPYCGRLILRRYDSRALTKRHGDPAALLFFADLLDQGGQTIAAAEILRFALDKVPHFPEARAMLLGFLAERGAHRAALDGLDRLMAERGQVSPRLAQVLLRILSLAGRPERYRRFLELRLKESLDSDSGALLMASLRAEQDTPGLLALAQELRRVTPWLVELDLAIARALLPQGAAEVEAALQIPRLVGGESLLDAADLLHQVGRDEVARDCVRRYLERRPGAERARLLARILGGGSNGVDARLGDVDLPALRAAADEELKRPRGSRPPLVALESSGHRRYALDGTSTTWSRLVLLRTSDEGGALEPRRLQASQSSETLSVPRLRVHKRSGGYVDLMVDRFERRSEVSSDVIDDSEQLLIELGDLDAGDLVVIETIRHSRGTPALRDRPSDVLFMQRDVPTRKSQAVVEVPAAWTFQRRLVSSHGRLFATHERQNGLARWTVRAEGLPAWGEAGPDDYAVYSTFQSWTELAYVYGKLFASAKHDSPRIQGILREILPGTLDRRTRINALHRWVSDTIRYLGVELEQHAYVPYSVPTVLERGYGDCKDKASLLAALLAEIGIRAVPVLVASSAGLVLEPTLPSLDVFNHLILYLPADGLYLDPTLPATPMGYVPAHVAGQTAFILDGTHEGPQRLPEQGKNANRVHEELDWSPGSSDSYRLRGSLLLTGELAFAFRASGADPAADKERLERTLARLYPQIDISAEGLEASLSTRKGLPVLTIRFEGRDPVSCRRIADADEGSSARRCAGFARNPLVIVERITGSQRPLVFTYHGSYTFPTFPSEEIERLPTYRREEVPGAMLRLTSAVSEGRVTVKVVHRRSQRGLPQVDRESLRRAWDETPDLVQWRTR